jgi:hypothetical protein
LRKIWFDRANLQVARLQLFGRHGLLLSDTRFADWRAVNAPATSDGGNSGAVAASPGQQFPHAIRIERPHDDYRLELQITKVTLNEEIPAERFKLEQPPGAELVRVGENTGEKTTGQDVQQ